MNDADMEVGGGGGQLRRRRNRESPPPPPPPMEQRRATADTATLPEQRANINDTTLSPQSPHPAVWWWLSTRTLSRWYGWVSLVSFILAIVTAPLPHTASRFSSRGVLSRYRTSTVKAAAATTSKQDNGSGASVAAMHGSDHTLSSSATVPASESESAAASLWETLFGGHTQQPQGGIGPTTTTTPSHLERDGPPAWIRWILKQDDEAKHATTTTTLPKVPQSQPPPKFLWWNLWGGDGGSGSGGGVSQFDSQAALGASVLAGTASSASPASAAAVTATIAPILSGTSRDSTVATERTLPSSPPWLLSWMDANIWSPHSNTLTSLIDKVWTSTVRLVLVANWSMVLTVLIHAAVADWFLGGAVLTTAAAAAAATSSNRNSGRLGDGPGDSAPSLPYEYQPWSALAGGGGSRMGGFLVFKLLLISAVVTADVVDLLILLSWYTILAVLRSLDALCAQQTDLCRIVWTGQTTAITTATTANLVPSGIWKLLVTILCADLTAATVCVTLFREAGYRMVVVLMCDCALLAVDIITHLLQHVQLVWDVSYAARVAAIEEDQMALWNRMAHTAMPSPPMDTIEEQSEMNGVGEETAMDNLGSFADGHHGTVAATDPPSVEEASRRLERQMALTEQQHLRRTSYLESAVYVQQLMTDVLTVAYFVHIWTLHGVQFTLIDGVLALHVHSAFTSACKKIAERRNMCRIARDMDSMFENASELDLRKAAAARDVCCICLGTMSYLHNADNHHQSNVHNNVKKVACGHLYHTACLRDVVERARSIESAKCPLCRSPLCNRGRAQQQSRNGTRREGGMGNGAPGLAQPPILGDVGRAPAGGRDDMGDNGDDGDFATAFRDPNADAAGRNNEDGAGAALFRFSTEGMFPAWIPFPAVSFVVLRRPPMTAANGPVGADGEGNANRDTDEGIRNANRAENNEERRNGAAQQQQSLLRRLLLLAGAVPMTPAEELAALDQLVDMFPQYERQDLLTALRTRGSAEAVTESILLGVFTGVPRGMGAR
jgi:CUE domain